MMMTLNTRVRLAPGIFVIAAILAALAPLRHQPGTAGAVARTAFPGWPTHYEGRRLTPLPMTEREDAFGRDFPGRIGRFSDGWHDIIVRFVGEPTRKLHPAADCLKAVGFAITPAPVRREKSGMLMSCSKAERGGVVLHVCEAIRNDRGDYWPDVSAWYWSAMFNGAGGPWWSFVVAGPG